VSDEFETAAKVGGGALGGISIASLVTWLVSRVVKKGDSDAEKLEKLQAAEVVRLRTELDALKAEMALKAPLTRVDGVAKDHGDRLNEHDRWLTKIDTRQRDTLGIADSAEVHTSPGYRPSPALAALQAKHRGNDGE
jgi:hypothetical protein